MRILYESERIDDLKQRTFLCDLLGYKIQRDMEMNRKLRALSGDSKTLTAIMNVARKSSSTGLTLDMILENMKTAMSMEIFSFKINGIDFFKLADDLIKEKKEFTLEVFLNPIYFSSEVALKGAVMPGFRKRSVDADYINDKMHKASQSWMHHFEKDIKEYIDISKVKRTILEEP